MPGGPAWGGPAPAPGCGPWMRPLAQFRPAERGRSWSVPRGDGIEGGVEPPSMPGGPAWGGPAPAPGCGPWMRPLAQFRPAERGRSWSVPRGDGIEGGVEPPSMPGGPAWGGPAPAPGCGPWMRPLAQFRPAERGRSWSVPRGDGIEGGVEPPSMPGGPAWERPGAGPECERQALGLPFFISVAPIPRRGGPGRLRSRRRAPRRRCAASPWRGGGGWPSRRLRAVLRGGA